MAASYKQLKDQIAKLEKDAAVARKKEAGEVILKIQALMSEFDLTPEDLGYKTTGKVGNKAKTKANAKPKTPGIPMYRDPKTGNTWTGRGKAPAWMSAAIKAGKTKAFLIEGAAKPTPKATLPTKASPAPVVKKASPPAAKKKSAPLKKAAAKAPTPAVAKKPAVKAVVAPAAQQAPASTAGAPA